MLKVQNQQVEKEQQMFPQETKVAKSAKSARRENMENENDKIKIKDIAEEYKIKYSTLVKRAKKNNICKKENKYIYIDKKDIEIILKEKQDIILISKIAKEYGEKTYILTKRAQRLNIIIEEDGHNYIKKENIEKILKKLKKGPKVKIRSNTK